MTAKFDERSMKRFLGASIHRRYTPPSGVRQGGRSRGEAEAEVTEHVVVARIGMVSRDCRAGVGCVPADRDAATGAGAGFAILSRGPVGLVDSRAAGGAGRSGTASTSLSTRRCEGAVASDGAGRAPLLGAFLGAGPGRDGQGTIRGDAAAETAAAAAAIAAVAANGVAAIPAAGWARAVATESVTARPAAAATAAAGCVCGESFASGQRYGSRPASCTIHRQKRIHPGCRCQLGRRRLVHRRPRSCRTKARRSLPGCFLRQRHAARAADSFIVSE